MRIGVDTRDLLLSRTGARTYLVEVLAALERVAGPHEIIPLRPQRAGAVRRANALDKVREHITFTWWKQVELPRLAAAKGCDVIFCTDFSAPLFSRAKTVPVFHDGNFWVNPEHYNRWWRLLMNTFAVPAARRSPAVVTVSAFAREEIAAHTGIPLERIVVIPNAAKSSTTAPPSPGETAHILAGYGLDANTPFVLHVGVLEKRKNLVRLVEAFAQFCTQVDQSYQLVLVGQPGPRQDMDDSANIQASIERLLLTDRVRQIGYVPDEHLPAFYQGATLLVFPSLREGFGIPILEAFSSRLSVAAARSSAIPEVAGDAALLFDPTDSTAIAEAMLRLAQDAALRQELIERGLERATLYSWDRTGRALIALFEGFFGEQS